MTTIKSTLKGSLAAVEINGPGSSRPAEGDSAFILDLLDGRGFEFHLPTAELAAALGLVTREGYDKLHAEWIELQSSPWKARWQDMRNDRDALRARLEQAEATIARVRESAVEMRATAQRATSSVASFAYNAAAHWIEKDLAAALDPKPPFTLPTEAGAGITAIGFGDTEDDREELRLFGDGKWRNAYGGAWGPVEVLEVFTDHSVIEAKP